jgi:hypothetical protein
MTLRTLSFHTITFYLIFLRRSLFMQNLDSMSHGGAHLSEILTKYLRVSIFSIHNFHTILHKNICFNYFDHLS